LITAFTSGVGIYRFGKIQASRSAANKSGQGLPDDRMFPRSAFKAETAASAELALRCRDDQRFQAKIPQMRLPFSSGARFNGLGRKFCALRQV